MQKKDLIPMRFSKRQLKKMLLSYKVEMIIALKDGKCFVNCPETNLKLFMIE